MVKLSEVQPSFEGMKTQLQQDAANRDALQDLIPAAIGQQMLEHSAAVGANAQFSIQQALRESFPFTARLDSSIYVSARSLGVRLYRRVPASVEVLLTRIDDTQAYLIPKLSEFAIGGDRFFNRDNITFEAGASQKTVTLYQGIVNTAAFTSNGQANQRFQIGNDPWTISDEDVYCTVGGSTDYTRITQSFSRYKATDRVFYENTMPNGNVECRFGSGAYGVIPPGGSNIIFTFVTTNGSGANKPATGLPVSLNQVTAITGTCQGPITGGTDQKPASFYRYISPKIAALPHETAVTKDDHTALILTYPGVLDVVVQNQADINPNNVTHMNALTVTLLTETVWTDADWAAFKTWFKGRRICGTYILKSDPVEVTTTVHVKVYATPNSVLTEVEDTVRQALIDRFTKQQGSLGKSVYISDVSTTVFDAFSDRKSVV